MVIGMAAFGLALVGMVHGLRRLEPRDSEGARAPVKERP
jgi:hypothetical protein